MYKFNEVNRFSRGTNYSVKNRAFPVKNQRKFISARCAGTIYCNVHVLTDGWKKKSHKEYRRYMRDCS